METMRVRQIVASLLLATDSELRQVVELLDDSTAKGLYEELRLVLKR